MLNLQKYHIARTIFFSLWLLLFSNGINAQYFGKNKVKYEKFDFKILETPHFHIYYYLDNEEKTKQFGILSERWYDRHYAIFKDSIRTNNPLIIYNDHADFQQTTVIQSLMGTGTQGVTEGLRNRVIMPFLPGNNQTDHVLGHELVHAFQFSVLLNQDSLGLSSLRNIPLWMVEGMAEYLSIGRVDPHTAMWMRDAVLNDDVPSINEMTKKMGEYFPYRYGHAFWAFVAGYWGDNIIRPLFVETAKFGYKKGIQSVLHYNADSLSTLWQKTIKNKYKPYLETTDTIPKGELLFGKENAGRINVAPSISPNGKYVTFLSDRDAITIDIFLADAENKQIIKKVTNTVHKSYIDEYMYIGSSGSWSPDNKKYALTTFSKGKNKLIIIKIDDNELFNTKKTNIIKKTDIPGIESFNNPAWSPDGKKILISGMVNGISDLYLYNIEKDEVTQLTDDPYSDLLPEWSPDGKKIVFMSDRGKNTNIEKIVYSKYKICILDLESNQTEVINIFNGVDNISPQFSNDGKSILFLSTADGFRNLYKYTINDSNVYKMTNYYTGICGITEFSPAYSISRETGDIVYTLYHDKSYSIYKATEDDFNLIPVNPDSINLSSGTLPPTDYISPKNTIDQKLKEIPGEDINTLVQKEYLPKFSLEYIGNTGVGVVGSSLYGAGMAGGINMLFGDILKHNQIFTALQVNGEIEDIGGMAIYMNKKTRINWGGGISHIPYRITYPVNIYDYSLINYRTFIDQVSLFSSFPISKKYRIEGGSSFTRYSFQIDSIFINNKGKREEKRLEGHDPYNVYQSYLAFVGDNSYYGYTSPLRGFRYRIQAQKYMGEINIWETNIDYRKYFFIKPVSFAFRGIYVGRHGATKDIENLYPLYPLYLGYTYYIRGYSYTTVDKESAAQSNNTINNNMLIGDNMGVFNAEIRLPFTGGEALSLFSSRLLYSDLVLFFDAGLTWKRLSTIKYTWDYQEEWNTRKEINEIAGDDNLEYVEQIAAEIPQYKDYRIPVYSAGLSLRINLFGYLILEPFYAFPFQLKHKDNRSGVFGLHIASFGW